MTTYRIADWDTRYEVNTKNRELSPGEVKRMGPLQYIRLKVHGHSQGVGWRKLLAIAGAHDAPAVFGIFCKLLELAADATRDKRGLIEDSPEMPIAFILGLDALDVQAALDVCCRLGWIERIEPEQAPPPKPETQNYARRAGPKNRDFDRLTSNVGATIQT